MKKENPLSFKNPDVFFLSLFGIGFFPKMPGTVGTLCVLPFLYALSFFAPPFWIFLPFIIVFTFGSCFIAESMQKRTQLSDPSWVVLDEALGIFIAWLFMRPSSILDLTILFLLFRIFDIFKPWPIAQIDKMKHGAGIILDDIAAGLYAALFFFFWTLTWKNFALKLKIIFMIFLRQQFSAIYKTSYWKRSCKYGDNV